MASGKHTHFGRTKPGFFPNDEEIAKQNARLNNLRKCVHFRMSPNTKFELDIVGTRLKLSRQEIMECIVEAILDNDPHVHQLLKEYKMKLLSYFDKKNLLKKTEDPTEDDLLEIIAAKNPFFSISIPNNNHKK